MLEVIRNWLIPPRIKTRSEVEDFVTKAAARLTHKSTVGYCKVKAGRQGPKLFKEKMFLESLETCRWSAFVEILSDKVLVLETLLRRDAQAADLAQPWRDGMVALYGDILNAHPPRDPDGWDDYIEAFAERLDRLRLAEPQGPAEISRHSGKLVFSLLPIHRSLRREDEEVIANLIRFNTVAFHQDMLERFDRAAVLHALAKPAARESAA